MPSPKARQQAYIASQSASDTSSDESDSAHDQQSSATSITAPDSKQDLKPAASTKDDFQLITSPALFKQTYKHLKELLQQHGWKEAEAEAFVVRLYSIILSRISLSNICLGIREGHLRHHDQYGKDEANYGRTRGS